MAPEQARGKIVDRRVDIWAFGCLLYEMLTGRRPFTGETVTDLLSAIVTREPDWDALPPQVPPAVARLVRRCLEKDPRKRLRDIGEARLTLEAPQTIAADASRAAEITAISRSRKRTVRLLMAAVCTPRRRRWSSGNSRRAAARSATRYDHAFRRTAAGPGRDVVLGVPTRSCPLGERQHRCVRGGVRRDRSCLCSPPAGSERTRRSWQRAWDGSGAFARWKVGGVLRRWRHPKGRNRRRSINDCQCSRRARHCVVR